MSDQVGARVYGLAEGDPEKQRLLNRIWLGAIGATDRVEPVAGKKPESFILRESKR